MSNNILTAEPSAAHLSDDKARVQLIVISISALVVSLSQTLLVPVLGILPAELDASVSSVGWLLTSTLLVGAVAVPIMGRLADMFGKRLLFLVALGALAVGSLITALTTNIGLLILGRSIQGVAVAAVPLGISILATTMPAERRGSAIALVSAMLGVGGALGMPLAGAVAEYSNWQMLFWISAVISIVCFFAVLATIAETERPGGRVDLVGAVLLSAALVCFFLPLSEGGDWGWGSTRVIVLFAASAVLLGVFGFSQTRIREPLVDLKALANPPILLTNIASVLFGFALFASMLGTAMFIEAPKETGYGMASSLLVGGLSLLPSGVMMLVFSAVAAKLIPMRGAAFTLALGGLVVALGWGMRVVWSGSMFEVLLGTTIVGIGTGIGYASIPTLINDNSPAHEIASANGLNALFRTMGSSLASAIGATLLAGTTVMVGPVAFPALAAYEQLFGLCAVMALGAAIIAIVLHTRKAQTQPA